MPKEEQQVPKKPNQTPVQLQTQQQQKPDQMTSQTELKENISQVQQENFYQTIVENLKFWNHPMIQLYYPQVKKFFVDEILTQSTKYYNDLPMQITDFKKNYIINNFGDQNQRMLLLGLSTVIFGLIQIKFNKGIRKPFRNTVFAYFGFGLFIEPEIYNPFLIARKQ